MRMVLRIVFKSCLAAISLTLMLLAVVYTTQMRDARDAAPRFIGQDQQEVSFLQDYSSTRQEMLMNFLRKTFPNLDLPEAEPAPVEPSSLQALKARTQRY